MALKRSAAAIAVVAAAAGCASERARSGTSAAPGAESARCADPESCIADYLSLPARVPPEHRRVPPHTWQEVDAWVASLAEDPLQVAPLAPAALARAVEVELNLGFLRSDLARRALDASARTAPGIQRGYEERRILFRDPWVGRFEAILLLPPGPGPFPAVLALHGHGDSPEIFRDDYHGREYPARGIAILMLGFRAMGVDADEHHATRALLGHGLHLMGLRVYESLVGLRYLRERPEIDAARIGLIGHSGGSSTGNLLIRVEPGLAAYVPDHSVDYRHLLWVERYHCETVPGLAPLQRQINDFSTSRVPVLRVPYGHGRRKWFGRGAREVDEILDFFAAQFRLRG